MSIKFEKYEVVNPLFHHTKNYNAGSQILMPADEAKGYGKSLKPWPEDKPDPEPPQEIKPSVYVSPKEEFDAKLAELQDKYDTKTSELLKLQELNFSLGKENAELQEANTEKDTAISELTTALENAKNDVKAYDVNLTDAKAEIERLNSELLKLQESKDINKSDEKKSEEKTSKRK